MDPLSISASIIALSQAAVVVAKGIRTLASIKNANIELLSLVDDLSLLQALLEKIPQLQDSPDSVSSATEPLILRIARVRLQETAASLEGLVTYLAVSDSGTDSQRASKRKWLQQGDKVKQCARESHEALLFGFNAINTLQLKVTDSKLDRVASSSSRTESSLLQVTDVLNDLQARFIQHSQDFEPVIHQVTSIQQIEQHLSRLVTTLANRDHDARHISRDQTHALGPGSGPILSIPTSIFLSCETACKCQCHVRSVLQTPRWLRFLLGHCLMQYKNIPFTQRMPCDVPICKSNPEMDIQLSYFFPKWFLARAVFGSLCWDTLMGPGASIHLSCPTVVSKTHNVWFALDHGNIAWLQRSFEKERALRSVVTQDGTSLLQYAIRNSSVNVISFLVEAGCNPTATDKHGRSPAREAKVRLLGDQIDGVGFSSMLRNVAGLKKDYINRKSTLIHECVLGYAGYPLEYSVTQQPFEINSFDELGNTPLHWAAWRGNVRAARTLLAHGAKVDIINQDGLVALHLAAKSTSGDMISLLLNNGADPNALNSIGMTPLHYAVMTHFFDWTVEALVDGGANVDAQTFEGESPLNILVKSATYRGIPRHPESCVDKLLASGANIDLPCCWGRTPVHHALRSARGFSLLKLLISAGARLDGVDCDGNSVLHYVALYGALRQIRYLNNGRLVNMDPDQRNTEGRSPLDCFEWRKAAEVGETAPGIVPPDANEVAAFEALIVELRERNWAAGLCLNTKATLDVNGSHLELQQRVLVAWEGTIFGEMMLETTSL